jgi:hypothetical protein
LAMGKQQEDAHRPHERQDEQHAEAGLRLR